MLFSDVWSENVTLYERLMEIRSNPPIGNTKIKNYYKKSIISGFKSLNLISALLVL